MHSWCSTYLAHKTATCGKSKTEWSMRFQAFTAMQVSSQFFWNIASCHWVKVPNMGQYGGPFFRVPMLNDINHPVIWDNCPKEWTQDYPSLTYSVLQQLEHYTFTLVKRFLNNGVFVCLDTKSRIWVQCPPPKKHESCNFHIICVCVCMSVHLFITSWKKSTLKVQDRHDHMSEYCII